MTDRARFGAFTLDQRAFELRRKGHSVRISASLFKLLVLFIERPGELVNREQIAACLWGQSEYVDVTNGINTAVNRLRAILGDNPAKPAYLETVVGAGYRFKMPVESEPEVATPTAATTVNATGREMTALLPATGTPVAVEERSPEVLATPEIPVPPPAPADLPRRQRRLAWLALLPVAGLIAVGGLLRSRPGHVPLKPSARVDFAQATFNDQSMPVTTQAISRDGKWLAYGDAHGLFAMELHSSLVRSLAFPHAFRAKRLLWQPDGAGLLVSGEVVSGEAEDDLKEPQIWMVALDGRAPRLLVHGGVDAALSPDSTRLAYTAARGSEVWLSDAQGRSPRRLYQAAPERTLSTLVWASDGTHLVLQECRTPALANLSLDLQGNPRRECAYESIDASSGRLLASQPDIAFSSAFLLAEGRFYFSRDLLTEEQSRAGLFLVQTDPRTGQFLEAPQLILRLPGDRVSQISASGDGHLLSALLARRSSDIFVADVNRSGPRLDHIRHLPHVAPDNYPHSWTPDSSAVVYESNSEGTYALYQQGLDGAPARLLAHSQNNAVVPMLSPDHKSIFFMDVPEALRADMPSLFRTPLAGGQIEQLPVHGQIYDYACPVNRVAQETLRCVVRETSRDRLKFFRFDAAHGEGAALADIPGTGSVTGDWSVSSNGQIIAIAGHDPAHPEVRLLDVSGSRPIETKVPLSLPEGGSLLSAVWSPAGDGFYGQVRSGVGYELVFIALSGRVTVLRQTFVPTWGVPSPDRKKLAFVDQTSNQNAWVGALVRADGQADLDLPIHYVKLTSLVDANR